MNINHFLSSFCHIFRRKSGRDNRGVGKRSYEGIYDVDIVGIFPIIKVDLGNYK